MREPKPLSRRDFIKLTGAGLFAAWASQYVDFNAHAAGIGHEMGETAGIIEGQYFTPQGTEMLLIPLRKDWTLDNAGTKARNPVSTTLNGGVILQARNIKNVQINGMNLKIAEVPFMGGNFPFNHEVSQNADQYLALAILEAGNKAFYESKFYSQNEIVSGFTAILEESVSPAEVHNILEGVKNFLDFQSANGGFPDGDYSFLKIQKNLMGDTVFMQTKDATGVTIAGGIGALASLTAKSLYDLTRRGQVSYLERDLQADGNTYFAGPTAPEITEDDSEAAVLVLSDSKHKGDFSWRFQGLGGVYLNISANILPNGENWKSGSGWDGLPADAKLVLSLNWTKSPPSQDQTNTIQKLINLYDGYHAEGPTSTSGLALLANGKENQISWSDALPISEAVRPELPTSNFTDEIDGSDAGRALENIADFIIKLGKSGREITGFSPKEVTKFYIALIYYFRDAVNDYNKEHPFTLGDAKENKLRPIGIGTYIRKRMQANGIYLPFQGISSLDSGLNNLDYNTYVVPEQSIQCLGYAGLLGKIGLPLSPNPNINNVSTGSASGLLSDPCRVALRNSGSYSNFDLDFARVDTIDEVQIGDAFVLYGSDVRNHIGAVIGKKSVDGETVLLISDANRKSDGVIRVFEVNKDNYRKIFGEGNAYPPAVIRNNNVRQYLDSNFLISLLDR